MLVSRNDLGSLISSLKQNLIINIKKTRAYTSEGENSE